MKTTVAYFLYRLYFCNCLSESFIEMAKFSVIERCFMKQLFNWQFLNSIFISLFISYSFGVKKIKAHLYSLPLCSIPILHFLMCLTLHLLRHVPVFWGMCHLVHRWQILPTLLSSSHLNSSWENNLWRCKQMVCLTYLGSRLAVLVLFQHLLSGYFLSSPLVRVSGRFMSKNIHRK